VPACNLLTLLTERVEADIARGAVQASRRDTLRSWGWPGTSQASASTR